MFVPSEFEGKMRVETCPISGTIERGADALEDAVQAAYVVGVTRQSKTPTARPSSRCAPRVDRNDKSRICAPGSVKVIGRRQIEMYSKLIHTVDHDYASICGRASTARPFLRRPLKEPRAVTVTALLKWLAASPSPSP